MIPEPYLFPSEIAALARHGKKISQLLSLADRANRIWGPDVRMAQEPPTTLHDLAIELSEVLTLAEINDLLPVAQALWLRAEAPGGD